MRLHEQRAALVRVGGTAAAAAAAARGVGVVEMVLLVFPHSAAPSIRLRQCLHAGQLLIEPPCRVGVDAAEGTGT